MYVILTITRQSTLIILHYTVHIECTFNFFDVERVNRCLRSMKLGEGPNPLHQFPHSKSATSS